MKRFAMLTLMLSFLVGAPGAASAEDANLGLAILDAAIVRPVAVVVSLASTGLYTGLAVPFYLMGVGEPTARAMIETPWWFTAGRPVGRFGTYYAPGPHR
ncbi:MAG: hypothetical protein ABFS46_16180 [Myxococcota bacterium]